MLGLAEQIGGAEFAVDRVVGNDQRFGGAGEQVDADAAEQLALGLGDIGIAGADDHVHGRDRFGAERHGRHRLHAAEHENLVGAAEMHGGDDRRMRPALERRRAGDDAFHAGNLRRDDRHVRGGDHRVTPAGHVAADRVHRDVAVAEHDAGQSLHLQVAHGLLLLLREIAHLGLRKFDVLEVALGHLRDRLLDVGGRELEVLRRPLVELFRQLADGGVLAFVDLRQNVFDRLAHLGVGGLYGSRVHAAFQVAGHGLSSCKITRDPGSAPGAVRDDRFAVT